MKKSLILVLLSSLFLSSLLTACQSQLFEIIESSDQFTGTTVSANSCSYGGEIKEVRAVDRFTVEFVLCYPDLAFPEKLAFPVFAIQDSEFLNFSEGNSELLGRTANGTGPYFVEDYEKGEYIRLSRKSEYWGIPPKSESIEFRWNADNADRQKIFLDGIGNGIDNFNPELRIAEQTNLNINVFYRPSISTSYLGFNNLIAPFDNPQIRKAIALGIDRARILDLYYSQGSLLAEQIAPPEISPGFSENLNWFESSLHEAVNLIENSGFDTNQEIVFYYVDEPSLNIPAPDQIARELKANLAVIGINLRLEKKSVQEFKDLFTNGEMGFFMTELSPEIPDAVNYYNSLFLGNNKAFGVIDEDLVDAITAASRTADKQTRQGYYDFVNQAIKQNVTIIPLYHGGSTLAFRDDVLNVLVGPMNENYSEMVSPSSSIIFLQEQEPLSLWPSDEVDQDTFRITSLIYDNLVTYEYGTTDLKPALAASWESNKELTQWTFYLRYDVQFLNGESLDANDVVASFSAIWDENNKNHVGRSGNFEYFKQLFGDFLTN